MYTKKRLMRLTKAELVEMVIENNSSFWNSFWGGAMTVLAALAVFWIAANGGVSIVGGVLGTAWNWISIVWGFLTTTGIKILGWITLILLFAGIGGWLLDKFTKKKGEG